MRLLEKTLLIEMFLQQDHMTKKMNQNVVQEQGQAKKRQYMPPQQPPPLDPNRPNPHANHTIVTKRVACILNTNGGGR